MDQQASRRMPVSAQPRTSAPFDAIVVGAGPAGCTIASLLGRRGHSVLLVDRAPVPRPRLCTHALMPSAVPVLAELGVLERVLAAGAQRWWGVRLSMDGVRIEAGLHRSHAISASGLSLRRHLLDPILLEAAAASPNVTVRLGWDALAPIVDDGAVCGVRLRSPDGHDETIDTRLVVAADGRRSRLLAGAGATRRTLPNRHIAWIAYIDGIPREERPMLEAYYRGGRSVSLLPSDGGLRIAGVVVPGNGWSRAEAPAQMLAAMREFPELRTKVANAEVVSRPMAARGLRNSVTLAAMPGIAAAGDAAIQSDPAFGQGISWALRGARRLALSADAALQGTTRGPIRLPSTASREPLALPLTLGMSVFSAIAPGSTIERLLVRSAAQAPKTSALALRVAVGFATVRDVHGRGRSVSAFLRDVVAPRSAPVRV